MRRRAASVLLLAATALAGEYTGKYAQDPRFFAVRARLPALRAQALARIADVLGETVADDFEICCEDAGADRSGLWAEVSTKTVDGRTRPVLVLKTEYLVLGAHDLERTLVHELYHCVQRRRLGEAAHLRTPAWAREGAAMYVAGQLAPRAAALVAFVGESADPVARLVDGLEGPHRLTDYVEDACAFHAVEARHGRAQAVALLRRLLETPDAKRAVHDVLGEDFASFEDATAAYARAYLAPLVATGRERYLALRDRFAKGRFAELLALPAPAGAYAAPAACDRALALENLARRDEALAAVRAFLRLHRANTTRLDEAILLELALLKSLGSKDYAAAADRARRDLEPFPSYDRVLALVGGSG